MPEELNPMEDVRVRVEMQRQRLYEVCNLLAAVARNTPEHSRLTDDTYGCMQIAQREIEAVVDDLEHVSKDVLAVQS